MKRTLIALTLAAAFAAPAHAGFMDEAFGESFTMLDLQESVHEALGAVYAPRLMSSRIVKGAPYSAEVITESNQPLADGNVISRKTVGAIYRDGEGRTRQETGGDGKKQSIVYINDPVNSTHIVLMPQSKHAIVTPRRFSLLHEHVTSKEKQVIKVGPREIRIEDGKVFLDGRDVSDSKVDIKVNNREVHVENGRVTVDGKEIARGHPRVIVKTIPEQETGDGTRREEVRVQVVRIGDGKEVVVPMPPTPPTPPNPTPPGTVMPVPPMPPIPGIETMRFESTARLGKGVTTQLGAKEFDGVRAEGKSTVWTIAAGTLGNKNAILITSESWYAPDLKVTVYSRYHDPRTGESIYRLANIRRAEPARDLFTIPAEYETKDRTAKRKEKDKDKERDRDRDRK